MAVHMITPSQAAAFAAGWSSVGFEEVEAGPEHESRTIWRVVEKNAEHLNFGEAYATADTLEEAEAWASENGMLKVHSYKLPRA